MASGQMKHAVKGLGFRVKGFRGLGFGVQAFYVSQGLSTSSLYLLLSLLATRTLAHLNLRISMSYSLNS